MKADLHTHTLCSDGVLSPLDLIQRAKNADVEMLSITDHDLVDAYADLPSELPLQLIPGIEVSAQWRGRGIHIVGLDIDLQAQSIQKVVKAQRQARGQRMQKICRRLEKLGLKIDLEVLEQQVGGAMLGRPQLASYLVETGQVESEQKAFSKYLGQGKAGDVHSQWPEVPEAIAAIKESGGKAVLAHPIKYRLTRTKLRELLADFVEAGGQAIEVVCGRQVPSDTRLLSELCREFGLYASMGSDFHRSAGYCELGQIPTIDADLKPVWELFSQA